MRVDPCEDCTVPAFTLESSGFRRDHECREGHLLFTFENSVTAEISHTDLTESWNAAAAMSMAEANNMSGQAARHLQAMLAEGIAAADLTDVVTDAAVILLLAMRRAGVTKPERIPACTIMWNGQRAQEQVLLEA